METKEEYETFGPEWKKEISKAPKALIIDMLSNKGKEVESLRQHLQSKETIIAGFKEMVGKLEGELKYAKDDAIKFKKDWEEKCHTVANLADDNDSLSACVRDLEEGIKWTLDEYIRCVNDSDEITEKLQSLLTSPQGE